MTHVIMALATTTVVIILAKIGGSMEA